MRSTPPRRPRWPFSVTLTSYQVGRPWMFDGKMLRGLTGMPMRRKLLANSSLAEAEPEPFTLANLTTKSLTASMRFVLVFVVVIARPWRFVSANPLSRGSWAEGAVGGFDFQK